MGNEDSRWTQWLQKFKKIQLYSAIVLVYITYNPEGLSYFHWAVRPWFEGLLGKGQWAAAGPHSLKAFIGIVLLIGWFVFLRTTKRKIGLFGIFLAMGFFATLGWVLVDYGFLPSIGGRILKHVILWITSFILMLGVLLPEPYKAPPKEPKLKGLFKRKEKEPEQAPEPSVSTPQETPSEQVS